LWPPRRGVSFKQPPDLVVTIAINADGIIPDATQAVSGDPAPLPPHTLRPRHNATTYLLFLCLDHVFVVVIVAVDYDFVFWVK
jgi:hypothetical protein